jgi:S1-C subfamily serine protease
MERDVLAELSDRLSGLFRAGAESVVRVEGRRSPASGVIWSSDGLVVTAHHVVEREEEIEIGLPGGDTVAAELVGRDPATDVALLRARASGLAPVEIAGPEGLEPGQIVLGVARPGRSPRTSLGLLARVAPEWRAPTGGKIDRYLETSLEVVPGVSGSLVLAATGSPLGVATAGLVRGAALVLPGPTLRRVVKALLAHGRVRRGYLGVATIPVRLPPEAERTAGQPTALLVTAVEPESPAARAGLKLGDAIVALAGASVGEPGDLLPLLEEERIGDAAPARVLRAGELATLTVTIGARERGGAR